MEGESPIASTSNEPYQEPTQSPFQEGQTFNDQQETTDGSVKLGKRKLSESSPPSSSSLDPSQSQTTTTTTVTTSEDSTPQYPSVAPLPVFAPPPSTLPSHPSFEFYSTRSHPFNKHSFRYTPCGPSPNSPLPVPPQRLIESEPRGQVRWSWEDRSVFTYLTQDAKTVTTDKGWRAVRSNVGLRSGDWFWEFKIERSNEQQQQQQVPTFEQPEGGGGGENSWVRVGIGRRESGLNAPVGVDGYSYGLRDKTGEKLTKSLPTVYGKPFKTGSTVGVYLSLPSNNEKTREEDSSESSSSSVSVRDPKKIQRKRVPILYKNQLYFEQLEYPTSKEMDELLVDPILKAKQLEQEESKKKKSKKSNQAPGIKVSQPSTEQQGPPLRDLPILKGSKLGFWIDGEFQGLAFEDLYDFIPLMKHSSKLYPQQKKEKTNRLVTVNYHDDGTTGYYPFVSVFGGGIVTLNSGPDFKFPPLDRDVDKLLGLEGEEVNGGSEKKRWRPLSERYQDFYEEQKRLDDLDELQQIEQLKLVREREQARIQRQIEKAERVAAAAAANNESGGGGGGVSKKLKISNHQEVVGNGLAVLGQFQQNQVLIGTAKGQEESPINSPKPSE
ncbi:hypothetical protein JCM5350_005422 [Sporobolomyces pararoseus]